MKTWLMLIVLAWWVVSWSGQKVAGPFQYATDCNNVAERMKAQGYNVKADCEFFLD